MDHHTKRNTEHLITVCCVIRNDSDILDDFTRQLSRLMVKHFEYYEVLFVDNQSNDQSQKLLAELQNELPNIRVLRLSRIYSKETALTSGLDNSIGDYVVVLEPRYDDINVIVDLVQRAIAGWDIVIARQALQERYKRVDRWFGDIAFKIAGRIIGQPINLQDSSYRVYSRRAVNALSQVRRKRRYLKYANSLIGYSQSYIDVPSSEKLASPKPVKRLESVSLVVDLVISNSAAPLRVTSLIGLFASFLNLLYIIYIVVIALINDNLVEGWLTTNIVMTVMFFLLFLVLTVLSEYIARILDETKDEPLYFIESESSSKVAPYTRLKQSDTSTNVVDN